MFRLLASVATLVTLMFFAPISLHAADPVKDTAVTNTSFYRDVRPLFQQHCQGCHQPAKANSAYVMTEHSALIKPGETGKPSVVPGKPNASFLIEEIKRDKDGHSEMPKGRDALKQVEIDVIAKWITEGAKDDTPPNAKETQITAERPPVYLAPPLITSVVFSPDGQLIAVAGYHEILLHKADGSAIVSRLVGLSERVQSLAFSPDGKFLAAAAGNPGRFGEVQIWDIDKLKLKLSAPVTFDTVYGVSWSPDGKIVGFGCADNTVRAIDPNTGKQVLFMGTHSDWVLGTSFSQDGQHLASVSRDMSMKLTEVGTQRFVDNVTSITPGALKGGLMAIDIRPSKERKMAKAPADTPTATTRVYDELLCAGSDGKPRLYKMHREVKREIGDDSNRLKEFTPMNGRISSIQFDRDGKRFAAASSLDGKGDVRVYDIASGKAITCEDITGPAYTVAWHPDGKRIASAGFDGKVWLHDAETGKRVKEFVAVPLTLKTARK